MVRWRFSGALWVLPATVLIVVGFLGQNYPSADPSPMSVGVYALWGQVVVVPVLAARAAWVAGRLRRAGWFARPWVRSPAAFALDEIWPLLACGVVAETAALATACAEFEAWVFPDPLPVAIAFLMIIVATLSGFALGRFVPTVVAAPVALGGWFVIGAFPPAMDPLWLRHLTGISDCCRVSEVLGWRVPVAVTSTYLGIGVLVAAVLAVGRVGRGRGGDSRPRVPAPAALGAAGAVCAGLIATGVGSVHELDFDPSVPRTGAMLCAPATADGRTVRVCVWPERRSTLTSAEQIVRTALIPLGRSDPSGLPSLITERETVDQASGERRFRTAPRPTDEQIASSIGSSVFPQITPRCSKIAEVAAADEHAEEGREPQDFSALYETQEDGALWWRVRVVSAAAGTKPTLETALELSAGTLPTGFAELWQMPPAKQSAWLRTAAEAVLACDPTRIPPEAAYHETAAGAR